MYQPSGGTYQRDGGMCQRDNGIGQESRLKQLSIVGEAQVIVGSFKLFVG